MWNDQTRPDPIRPEITQPNQTWHDITQPNPTQLYPSVVYLIYQPTTPVAPLWHPLPFPEFSDFSENPDFSRFVRLSCVQRKNLNNTHKQNILKTLSKKPAFNQYINSTSHQKASFTKKHTEIQGALLWVLYTVCFILPPKRVKNKHSEDGASKDVKSGKQYYCN